MSLFFIKSHLFNLDYYSTARIGVSSIGSQNKLDLPVHVFIVDGFAFFKVDPSSCLQNLVLVNANWKKLLKSKVYHKGFLISSCSPVLVEPPF